MRSRDTEQSILRRNASRIQNAKLRRDKSPETLVKPLRDATYSVATNRRFSTPTNFKMGLLIPNVVDARTWPDQRFGGSQSEKLNANGCGQMRGKTLRQYKFHGNLRA